MAKVKFGKDDWSELMEMADNGELPDSQRLIHLLGRGRVIGEYDD